MEASSGQFLRLLYVEAPLDNFLRLLYGTPLWSVSSLTIWGPALQINFFASYVGASSDQFFCILYIGGPLRSFSSPIRGPQFSFFTYYMGPPQINVFASYVGASSDQFLRILYSGPPQVIFFAYREPSVQFLRILYGAPRPPPSDKFLCFLCGGLFRSVSSHRGPLQVNFFAYYM